MLIPEQRSTTLGQARIMYRYVWFVGIIWVFILIAGPWRIDKASHKAVRQLATNQARASIAKDVLYRTWMGHMGGLYSPVTEYIKPNSYFPEENRDLLTSQGDSLTIINPTYMSRMVYKLSVDSGYVQGGHVASLKPVHPGNVATDWEKRALAKLSDGRNEYSEIVEDENGAVLRFMRPISFINPGCLDCHQGYELGDVEGGISVAVDLVPINETARIHRNGELTVFFIIWFVGLGLLCFGAFQLRKNIKQIETSQQELHEQRTFLQNIIDQSPVLLFIKDLEGRIVMCNKAFAAAYGADPVDLYGKTDSELLNDSASVERYQNEDWEVIQSRKEKLIPEGPFMPGDEPQRFVQTIKSPLFDADGNVCNLLCVSMEITERKQAETALRRSENHLRVIIESTNDGILVMTINDFKKVFANPRFREMFQYTEEELDDPEFNYCQLIDEDDQGKQKPKCEAFLGSDRERMTIKLGAWRKNKTRLHVEITLSKIVWEGQPALLAVHRDITEKETLEAELRRQQKIDAIGALAGGIAHDFNNIITGIIAHAEIASLRYQPDDNIQKELDGILRSADRAAELTRKLLAFSRKQFLQFESISLNSMILEISQLLRRIIRENIQLDTQLDENHWPVYADKSQMEQVVLNLVVNARDAIQESGMLTIRTMNTTLSEEECQRFTELQPGDYAVLEVEDSGHGMSEEVIEHIFEPFFTTKETGKGSGLGLSTVYGIVKQCKGDIVVTSKPGKGTCFRLHFPRAETEPVNHQAKMKKGDFHGKGELILVVEDEESVRLHLVRTLQALNYVVVEAENGLAALELVKSLDQAPELVVADVVMPGMGGIQMVQILSGMYPSLKVLFISGYAGDNLISSREMETPFVYLQKPFHASELARQVFLLITGEQNG